MRYSYGSSAIWRFEGNDAIEIHDGILTFDFYTGLPHVIFNIPCHLLAYNWRQPLENLAIYFRVVADKCDVVVLTKMGVYIHGVFIFYQCLLSRFYGTWIKESCEIAYNDITMM